MLPTKVQDKFKKKEVWGVLEIRKMYPNSLCDKIINKIIIRIRTNGRKKRVMIEERL